MPPSTHRVHVVPILRDNYCYIIEGDDRRCVVIDPGQVAPVQLFLRQNNLTPALILNTHHHADHVAGNAELGSAYDIPVIGPAGEQKLIPHISRGVIHGDTIEEANIRFEVIETPGHTNGHIVFYAPCLNALFTGDTVFSMGCGRLMEGTAEQMFSSLQKLKRLPPQSNIYGGHEYTESNGCFALSVEPNNADLHTRMAEVAKRRANNLATYPVLLETELKTNPFLRVDSEKKFAELRLRKDSF